MNLPDQPVADRVAIIGAMVDRLADYLATDSLYLPVMAENGGRRDAVTLTLGVVLDALDALAADAPGDAAPLVARFHKAAAQQPAAYADKLRHELRSAVAVWRATADDLAREPERADDGWGEAARQRTRAAQLMSEIGRVGAAHDAAAETALAAADAVARARTVAAPFGGRPEAAGRFGRDAYWWLWRRPPSD